MRGYDCSGFMQELLVSQGIKFDKDLTAHGIYEYMKYNGMEGAEEGALAFYGTVQRVTHIAMFLDQNLIIEAAGGGSRTHTEQDAIRHNAFIRVRPFDYREDLIASIMPHYPFID